MLYKDFEEVVGLLKQCEKNMVTSRDYINIDIFDAHNNLITKLLSLEYSWVTVQYILDEWLRGNKSSITFTPEGSQDSVEVPCKTVSDLWKAMEAFGKNE